MHSLKKRDSKDDEYLFICYYLYHFKQSEWDVEISRCWEDKMKIDDTNCFATNSTKANL